MHGHGHGPHLANGPTVLLPCHCGARSRHVMGPLMHPHASTTLPTAYVALTRHSMAWPCMTIHALPCLSFLSPSLSFLPSLPPSLAGLAWCEWGVPALLLLGMALGDCTSLLSSFSGSSRSSSSGSGSRGGSSLAATYFHSWRPGQPHAIPLTRQLGHHTHLALLLDLSLSHTHCLTASLPVGSSHQRAVAHNTRRELQRNLNGAIVVIVILATGKKRGSDDTEEEGDEEFTTIARLIEWRNARWLVWCVCRLGRRGQFERER